MSPALASTAPNAAGSPSHRAHKLAAHRRSHHAVVRGQQSIDTERATQIQQALIREHYLAGEPSGKWDPETVAAMQKYQADQGWQTKLMPDSRALKKLGLGPDYSNALNAGNSNLSAPPPPAGTTPAPQNAGFAAASGVNQ
jgi:peptidoglycan hydrolase-like protein with peptidoglycan-binding domain